MNTTYAIIIVMAALVVLTIASVRRHLERSATRRRLESLDELCPEPVAPRYAQNSLDVLRDARSERMDFGVSPVYARR